MANVSAISPRLAEEIAMASGVRFTREASLCRGVVMVMKHLRRVWAWGRSGAAQGSFIAAQPRGAIATRFGWRTVTECLASARSAYCNKKLALVLPPKPLEVTVALT